MAVKRSTYTNRKLVDVLKTAGLSSVYSTLINTYEFALETLYPVIPDLLDQGLGRPANQPHQQTAERSTDALGAS